MRLLPFLFCILVLSVLLHVQAHAFGFSPFKMELAPDGEHASQVFEITNNEEYAQAVQVGVQRWQQDKEGAESNAPADDVLAVYPRQFILKPKSVQTVRVRWMGPKDIASEQAFRVVAEQLPVNFDVDPRAKKAIRFLVTYRAALYVRPQDARHEVVVENIEPAAGPEQHLELTLTNKGNAHVLMKEPVVTLKTKDGEVKVADAHVSHLEGENIHAGVSRKVTIPLPAGLKEMPTHASLDFVPEF
jgi:fimbrial chaperone protein